MAVSQSGNFYRLLRLSLGVAQEFPVVETAEDWWRLYQTADCQSLLGVCYQGICQLPDDLKPPLELILQWAADAESIRGQNNLLNQEAVRLTELFAQQGCKSAILKGQANARYYPDPMSRQPGDIDIWVEGGRKRIIDLLWKTGMINEDPGLVAVDGKASASYHHVHLPQTQDGVIVEVHFRPSSGNFDPVTNRRLQRWLEQEVLNTTAVQPALVSPDSGETGMTFNAPSMQFALVMQLSHIQRHFLGTGIGLRQICDYYLLLQNASDDDRRKVAAQLEQFGLSHVAGALMWVLAKVLYLDGGLMLCEPDSYRGEWMLREIMDGGNFGNYAPREQHSVWRRFFLSKMNRLKMLRFSFWEIFWQEVEYWKTIVKTIPIRIKYRTISLRDVQR